MTGVDGCFCIYCLAPHPKVTHTTKKTAGIRQIFVGTMEETTNITPIIECPVCDKKYLLISESMDREFNEQFIGHLHLSEDCLGLLQRYQISRTDLLAGVRGVSKVQWVKDTVMNAFKPVNANERHFHLVFSKAEDVYFIDITKNNLGESLGTNLEKVLL